MDWIEVKSFWLDCPHFADVFEGRAALAGFRPIAEIMLMNFVTVAMGQIVNHAAKLRFISGGQTTVPMVLRTTTGVGVGVGFGGQHSDMLEAWFAQ
jgi:acetoin:2,6-dichlorophenolindophenol oxidoreductase subunit beta